jgi:hypothetical protein
MLDIGLPSFSLGKVLFLLELPKLMEVLSVSKELTLMIYGRTRRRRKAQRVICLHLARKELSTSTNRQSIIHGSF